MISWLISANELLCNQKMCNYWITRFLMGLLYWALLLIWLCSFLPALFLLCMSSSCLCVHTPHVCVLCSSSRPVPAAHGGGELWSVHTALVLQQPCSGLQTLHLQRLWRKRQPLPSLGGVWGGLPWGGRRYSNTHTHIHTLVSARCWMYED